MSYLRKKYNLDSDSENSNDDYDNDINNIINEVMNDNKITSKSNIIKVQNTQKKSDEELLSDYNKLLKKYWGYDELKCQQFEIIKKVVEENKDVCAILATGFGKSICYQLPYLITKKNVIVISPLIALMHEQGQEMLSKGIPTAIFNSDTTTKKKNEEKEEIINGTTKLIFMTPEYFIKSYEFIQEIKHNLSMICIDESHAVSTWGLDFRPGYTELKVIKDWSPETPILTLTATASVKVREDIYRILRLDNPELVVGSFDRPNLSISVYAKKDNIMENISNLLNKYLNKYVIIYCKTRDDTDLLALKIRELGINAESYHAGMNDKNRKQVQQDFIDGNIKCICATIAFGMGINIPNVRLVIHYNCPKNLESYYQEIGRAGRDGKPSECVLFYSAKDFQINRFLIKDMKNIVQKQYQEEQIRQIEKYVYATICRRNIILSNFGQNIESCTNCDNCIKSKILKQKITMIDYTCPIYILLNVLNKTNSKFGFGMCLNVLLAKKSKAKEWMINWEEYGTGLSFGNDDWWKELLRHLINDDLVVEIQSQGMFFSTTGLSNKGKSLRSKIISKYPNYIDLLQDFNGNPDSKQYKQNQLLYPEIMSVKKSVKKSSTVKKSELVEKSETIKKLEPVEKLETIKKLEPVEKLETIKKSKTVKKTESKKKKSSTGTTIKNKLSYILDTDSDSKSDSD